MTEHSKLDVFGALADPTRREILVLLKDRTMTAGDIAARFPQQRPAISKHLRVLRESGLLRERRAAQRRLYALRSGGTTPISDLLNRLIRSEFESIPPAPDAGPRAGPTTITDSEFDVELD